MLNQIGIGYPVRESFQTIQYRIGAHIKISYLDVQLFMAHSLKYSLSDLPESLRKQVEDFIEFLLRKYQPAEESPKQPSKYPLRGSVIRYDDPFGPV
ncbi:MAG: DUF2281 domain-containing protein [Bacteroidota bacterium]